MSQLSESMRDQLTVMVELQRKDIELRKLLESRASIPGVIRQRDGQLDEAQRRIAGMEEELKAVSMKKRSMDGDVEAMEAKTKEKEIQLLRVSNNKEYQALLSEINNAKALLSNTEGNLLRIMEQEEALAGELNDARRELAAHTDEIERSKAKLEEELETNEGIIPGLQLDRERTASRLSPEVRSKYERIAKGKNGCAVVPVKKGACGGCFTALPAQRINEIRRNDRLIACEHCGRVLVWNDEGDPEGRPV